MISKKELLKRTGISYGQLYRWKREELIPEEWFHKTSAPTGQETFFEEDQILPRIEKILELKDDFSIEEMRRAFAVSAKEGEIETRRLFAVERLCTEVINALAVGETVPVWLAAYIGAFSRAEKECAVEKELLTHFPLAEGMGDGVTVFEHEGKRGVVVGFGAMAFSSNVRVVKHYSLAEEGADLLAQTKHGRIA